MKNVQDAGFSRRRGGNAGSGPPLPDPDSKLDHNYFNSFSIILSITNLTYCTLDSI